MKRSRNHEAALRYADHGYAVFPLAPGTKIPMKGSHAELDGTTDLDQVDRWWGRLPEAGVACALRFTEWFVLDIDARAGGDQWLAAMLGCDALDTLTAVSGSGWPSAHYWLRRVPELRGMHSKGVAGTTGVELKGLPYGYVVLPPTIHPKTGQRYAWHDGGDPLDLDSIVDPPRWLLESILRTSRPGHGLGPQSYDLELEAFPRGRQLLADRWPMGAKLGPGRWICECPNVRSHTDDGKRRNDSSCVLFAPRRPGGWGRIYCSHSRCGSIR